MKTNQKVYRTDIYVRLSREDGDKIESDSITNQKELIKSFISNKPEFQIHQIRVDDGYTGVNFQRPAFQAMLEDIKAGKVDCVIVKDLSRFGRNYIEAGKYITNIFPFLGVRFIAINDSYDTALTNNPSNVILVHFKNFMNDSYCNDISVKTRSSLKIKCKNGDYIGSYAPYGYIKSTANKNQLVIDETVKSVVQNIFSWRLSGMSALRIAQKLNSLGIASPMEHKSELGIPYRSALKTKANAQWSAKAITRILKNRVYTGTLEQCKTTTPNYKVKSLIKKPKDQWIRAENCHEAIISTKTFDLVQQLLEEDTRVSPKNDKTYIFSGVLKCGICGGNLTRKVITSSGKKFEYYICINNKNNKTCDNTTNFPVKKLEKTVLDIINIHLLQFADMQSMLKKISDMPVQNDAIKKLISEKDNCLTKIDLIKKHSAELYDDFKSNLISEEEFKNIRQMYLEEISSLSKQATNIKREIEVISLSKKSEIDNYTKFISNGKLEKLDRELVVELIDKILIYDKNHIELVFKFQNDFDIIKEYINKMYETSPILKNIAAEVV